MTSGVFKLSSFCLHLKDKKCIKRSKMEYDKENNIDNDRNSSASQPMAPNHSRKSSSVESKKDKASTHTTKRFRSPSTQGSSNTSNTITKNNRPLSKNSTNASHL
ncbi:unnamed protein product [Rotaria sp. Silwood2]|nr:unnamed protein product [Rotaria sp. Silwood2]CAF4557161.1 unnamed protein product [Rotaria sp. Silwood2]